MFTLLTQTTALRTEAIHSRSRRTHVDTEEIKQSLSQVPSLRPPKHADIILRQDLLHDDVHDLTLSNIPLLRPSSLG